MPMCPPPFHAHVLTLTLGPPSPPPLHPHTQFLALDPAAAYITGQCYNIDGGMVMN